jgi:hypothetical protein
MPLFMPMKRNKLVSKVHYSQYITTENKSNEADLKPAEPARPEQAEAK